MFAHNEAIVNLIWVHGWRYCVNIIWEGFGQSVWRANSNFGTVCVGESIGLRGQAWQVQTIPGLRSVNTVNTD